MPAVGATAIATPPASFGPYYDADASATIWGQQKTQAHGAVWFVGLPAGSVSIAVTAAGGAVTTLPEAIEMGSLTFATSSL